MELIVTWSSLVERLHAVAQHLDGDAQVGAQAGEGGHGASPLSFGKVPLRKPRSLGRASGACSARVKLAAVGCEPYVSTPEQFGTLIRSELP
jgi:hypothetical protein